MNKVDVFPYYNEEELLELRIKLLDEKIDKFVICEANRTQTGNPKPFTVKKTLKKLGLLSDKITVVEVDLSHRDSDIKSYGRERYQRNCALSYIEDDDVCFVSDCDEIVSPKYIDYYANRALDLTDNIIRLPLAFLMSRADLQVCDNNGIPKDWNPAFVGLKKHFKSYTISDIREAYSFNKQIAFPSIFLTDNGFVEKAGWHFSWMGDNDRNLNKIFNCADFSDNPNAYLAQDHLTKRVKNFRPTVGDIDVLGRSDHILQPYPLQLLPGLLFELPKVLLCLLPDCKDLIMPPLFNRIKDGHNWFTYPMLYSEMVRSFPSGSTFVEVGSWKGRSSAYMAVEIANSQKQIHFYCVDHWKGSADHVDVEENLYEIFCDNMYPVRDYYTEIIAESLEAATQFADQSVDFVFIDASHDYESVKQDILAWLPKVKPGGVLAGHDYYPPWHGCYTNDLTVCGVYQAVNEIFAGQDIRFAENCFVVRMK